MLFRSRGCHDTAVAFAAPFVSGKDSLNNVFSHTDAAGNHHELSIPPTLLATAMGQVDDVRKAMTPDLKSPGSRLAIVGLTRDELAGSQLEICGHVTDGRIPHVDTSACRATFAAVAAAIRSGCVAACHDISDGGIAAAVAEMAIAGGCGARLDLAAVPAEITEADAAHRDLAIAFAETPGRFVCEVPVAAAERFASVVGDVPWAWAGTVTAEPSLDLAATDGRSLRVPVAALSDAWRSLGKSPPSPSSHDACSHPAP